MKTSYRSCMYRTRCQESVSTQKKGTTGCSLFLSRVCSLKRLIVHYGLHIEGVSGRVTVMARLLSTPSKNSS